MADLPRPTIQVDTFPTPLADGERVRVGITRGNATRSYDVTAPTQSEAIKGVVDQIISDPMTAEWLPPARKTP